MKKIFLLFILIIISIYLYADNSNFVLDSENKLIGYRGTNSIVHIPNGIKGIKSTAFENTPFVKEIYLPNTLGSFSYGAFINCYNLENIFVEPGNQYLESHDGILYLSTYNNETFDFTTALCFYPINKNEKVFYIPSSVNIIGANCFTYNKHLEAIYSIDKIEKIDDFTFSYCNNLKKIDIKLSDNCKIPKACFAKCSNLEEIHTKISPESKALRAVENLAFSFCENLSYIDFNIKEYIGDSAFSYTGIYSINIDNNTKIHKDAFVKSTIYKINLDKYDIFSKNYLTLDEVRQKFNNVKSDTLTEIYFKGFDKKQHLYNFKTKQKVY